MFLGGPLLYVDNNVIFLVGIVSYGIGCASNHPSVNTRVTAYLDWIEVNTRSPNYCVKWKAQSACFGGINSKTFEKVMFWSFLGFDYHLTSECMQLITYLVWEIQSILLLSGALRHSYQHQGIPQSTKWRETFLILIPTIWSAVANWLFLWVIGEISPVQKKSAFIFQRLKHSKVYFFRAIPVLSVWSWGKPIIN